MVAIASSRIEVEGSTQKAMTEKMKELHWKCKAKCHKEKKHAERLKSQCDLKSRVIVDQQEQIQQLLDALRENDVVVSNEGDKDPFPGWVKEDCGGGNSIQELAIGDLHHEGICRWLQKHGILSLSHLVHS